MGKNGFCDIRILPLIKEVKEAEQKEATQLLSNGNWIAIYAAEHADIVTFVLGRIS